MLLKQNTTPTFTVVCDIPVSGAFSNPTPSSYSYSKAGGSLTAGSGIVVTYYQPSANSVYLVSITLAAGEADTLGDLLIAVLDASGDLIGSINLEVVAFDPGDATALGLSALPSHNAGASGGLWVLGNNAGNVSFSGTMSYSGTVTMSAGVQINPGIWIHGIGTGSGSGVATLYVQGTGNNVPGLEIDGNGTGASTLLVGGATGPGLQITGGSTSGAAIALSNTSGSVLTGLWDALLDWANGVESGFTLRQALRLVLAAVAGKLSGAATTSVTIRDVNDTKNRISATVDSSGDRTAVTYNVT